jgi:hypothetical protein
MHVFVSVSWHTSAALMESNSKTTNVQCTLSEGSLDLLWRAKTPPHKRVCECFLITAFGLLSTHGRCLLYVAAGPFRVGHALQYKRTKHAKNQGSSDLATCNRINDFHFPARSAIRTHTEHYRTGIEYTRRHSITVHEHKVALNGFCILVWNQAIGRLHQ